MLPEDALGNLPPISPPSSFTPPQVFFGRSSIPTRPHPRCAEASLSPHGSPSSLPGLLALWELLSVCLSGLTSIFGASV